MLDVLFTLLLGMDFLPGKLTDFLSLVGNLFSVDEDAVLTDIVLPGPRLLHEVFLTSNIFPNCISPAPK